MSNLDKKIIAYLGRTPDFTSEVKLQDDGNGVVYIKEWNITSEKAKPTDSQLNALSSQATTLENNAKIDAKRQTEYLSWQQQFEMIYKDQKNGTTTYKDHCDKVRSDNPKE
tara:strand:+ start:644 stop:976 length:333 start_codon:yes stop_codon:yes gene_type:complete